MALCLICFEQLRPWEMRDMFCTKCKEQQVLLSYVRDSKTNDDGLGEREVTP